MFRDILAKMRLALNLLTMLPILGKTGKKIYDAISANIAAKNEKELTISG